MPFDGRDYFSFQPIPKSRYLSHQVFGGTLWGGILRNAYAYARHHAQGMHCFSWPRPSQLAANFDDPNTIVGGGPATPQRIYPWRHYVAEFWTHVHVHFVFSLSMDTETSVELQLTAGTDASPAQDTVTVTVPVGAGVLQPADGLELVDPFLDGARYETIVTLPLANARGPGRRFFQLFGRSVPIGVVVGDIYPGLRPDAVSAWLTAEG